jgi:hypothetical protein
MNQIDILDEGGLKGRKEGKVYGKTKLLIGTFFAGAFVGGYMLAANYKILGQKEKVLPTWLAVIAVTIAMIGIIFFVPGGEGIPSAAFTLPIVGVIALVYKNTQEEAVEQFIAEGGEEYSGWRVVGLVAVVASIFIILGVGTYLFYAEQIEEGDWIEQTIEEPAPAPESDIATLSYGDEGHNITYFTNQFSSLDVDEIGDELVNEGYLEAPAKNIFVEFFEGQVVFSVADPAVDAENPNTAANAETYGRLARGMQVFLEEPVRVLLMSEDFQTVLAEY